MALFCCEHSPLLPSQPGENKSEFRLQPCWAFFGNEVVFSLSLVLLKIYKSNAWFQQRCGVADDDITSPDHKKKKKQNTLNIRRHQVWIKVSVLPSVHYWFWTSTNQEVLWNHELKQDRDRWVFTEGNTKTFYEVVVTLWIPCPSPAPSIWGLKHSFQKLIKEIALFSSKVFRPWSSLTPGWMGVQGLNDLLAEVSFVSPRPGSSASYHVTSSNFPLLAY